MIRDSGLNLARGLQASSCQSCVASPNCVYCQSIFDDYSPCVCNGVSSFYSETYCSSYFGSKELSSTLDCQFKSPNGEIILAVIIIIPMLIILCGVCAACKHWEHEDELYNNSTNKNGVNRQPAYVPDAAYTVAGATITNMMEQVTTIGVSAPSMRE
jgi:hypothetical protein